MDPNATIRLIIESYRDEREEGKAERTTLMADLAKWLESGGFKPRCAHLGIEKAEHGGDGFNGPRHEYERRVTHISGGDCTLRKWGNHYALQTPGKVYHLPK